MRDVTCSRKRKKNKNDKIKKKGGDREANIMEIDLPDDFHSLKILLKRGVNARQGPHQWALK